MKKHSVWRVVAAVPFVLLVSVSAALANPGDSWILPIDHRDGGGWTEYAGAGYGGTSAWGASNMDGTRRVYWELSGTGVPTTTELFAIEFYDPTAGGDDWQPISSQFYGAGGETYPMEPGIPWAGAFGTNHQYIGSQGSTGTDGDWASTGPGPHNPEDASYTAGPNGIYMWLTDGSWLYAMWDYPWDIDRSWSALRVTQITGETEAAAVAEPAALGLIGLAMLAVRRKRSL